jgi:hypothetical protein
MKVREEWNSTLVRWVDAVRAIACPHAGKPVSACGRNRYSGGLCEMPLPFSQNAAM